MRLPHADCIAKQVRYMHQHEMILGKQVHHVPLVACISLHWMCWKHRSESCPPSFDKMLFWQDASCNHPRFQALMAELRRKLPGSSLETIEVLLHQLGCKHYPATSSHARALAPSSELVQCVHKRWLILHTVKSILPWLVLSYSASQASAASSVEAQAHATTAG